MNGEQKCKISIKCNSVKYFLRFELHGAKSFLKGWSINFVPFMESEDLLSYLQETTTWHLSEPLESSPLISKWNFMESEIP
jgi:hypothetical protein